MHFGGSVFGDSRSGYRKTPGLVGGIEMMRLGINDGPAILNLRKTLRHLGKGREGRA